MIMLVWNDACIWVCCDSNMLWTDDQFIHKSLILLIRYFFNRLCADSTLFVIVFPICITLFTQNLTNFSFIDPKNCSFNIFKKLRNVSHTILNRLQFSIYACSVSDSLPRNHEFLHHFTWLDLFSIIAFKILNFAIRLTFCSNISSNAILTQQSTLSRSVTTTLGEISLECW
jgi:hypothetical protein